MDESPLDVPIQEEWRRIGSVEKRDEEQDQQQMRRVSWRFMRE